MAIEIGTVIHKVWVPLLSTNRYSYPEGVGFQDRMWQMFWVGAAHSQHQPLSQLVTMSKCELLLLYITDLMGVKVVKSKG